MCIREELESVDFLTIGEGPQNNPDDVSIPWTPPENKYMRSMRSYMNRPSFFSVVGKTARTVNLLEFFDWMDDQGRTKKGATGVF